MQKTPVKKKTEKSTISPSMGTCKAKALTENYSGLVVYVAQRIALLKN